MIAYSLEVYEEENGNEIATVTGYSVDSVMEQAHKIEAAAKRYESEEL